MTSPPIDDVSSEPTPSPSLDYSNPVDLEQAVRIGRAWFELRRSAGASVLRDYYFGNDDPLEQGQMDALDLLTRRDLAMRALADRLRIDPSSATRAVQRVVNAGFAERYRSPDDGRVVMVRVTAEGRRRHAAVARRRATAMKRIVGSFEPAEREVLAEMLERLTAAIDSVVDTLDDDCKP